MSSTAYPIPPTQSVGDSQFFNGMGGTALFGGVEVPVISWRVDPKQDSVTIMNSLSGSGKLEIPNFFQVTGSVVFDFDLNNDPFFNLDLWTVGPLGGVMFSYINDLYLYLHQTSASAHDGLRWHIPTAALTGTPNDIVVAGKVGTSVTFKSSGSVWPPGATS